MLLLTSIFFICLFFIFYIYVGYPMGIFLYSLIKKRNINALPYNTYITIIISAYNEEENIEETIKNKLSINYPRDKFQIIVVSDGSVDRTDSIVKKYEHCGVMLLRQEPRAGKTAALNMAAQQARGDILVFSDANSLYDQDALNMLLENFNDPSIGYVTGKMIYSNPENLMTGNGCNGYMKYENVIRSIETKIGSIVGVDGAIDAMRKTLYQPMNPDQLPDFILPLRVVERGYRVVYEPRALLQESSLKSSRDEYRMRVRVALRALWGLKDMKHLLNFKKYGIFSFQLLSHKILRYSAFIFMILLYISTMFLYNTYLFFQGFFLLQSIFYLCAFVSFFLEKYGINSGFLYIPYYFSLINLACAHASLKFLWGKKQVMWVPRVG